MPNVTGGTTPFNMGDPFQFFALYNSYLLLPQTSTAFATSDLASRTWLFNGTSFTYTAEGVPNGGTLTSLTYFENNVAVFTVNGLSRPLVQFLNQLALSDLNGMLTTMFAGEDTITGSTGFDNLFGYGGDDTITAGAGGDALRGGSGHDTLNGGADFDFLYGDSGGGTLHGNGGADLLDGGADSDILNGGSGADDLDGGSGFDTLNGGDDGDTLRSSTDADMIDGGAGSDTLLLSRLALSTAFTITASDLMSALGVTLVDGTTVRNIEHFNITLGAGADTLHVTGPLAVTGYGANHFNGGAGFDRIYADFSASSLVVGAMLTWANIDELHIQGGSNDDILYGTSGNDELIGNGGSDRLSGEGGVDYLSGGAGNDFLTIVGSGTALGGADNDTLTVTLASAAQTATIDGGAGQDSLDLYWTDAAGLNVTLGAGSAILGVENVTLNTMGGGADTLYLSHPGADPLNPSGVFVWNAYEGSDHLVVDLGDVQNAVSLFSSSLAFGSTFSLYYSSVELFELWTGAGADNLNGYSNRDIFHSGAGADILHGGEGNDDLYGGADNDTLYGNQGVNLLDGGDGDDTIHSIGFDIIDGGGGNDLLIIDREYNQDNIIFDAGGEATSPDGTIIRNIERFDISTGYADDTLTIVGALTGENVWDASEQWVLVPINPADPFGGFTLQPAVEHDRLVIDFSWSNETINFNSYYFLGDDWLLTTIGVDEFWITGTAGADYLWSGGRQGSRLIGAGGDDSIRGFYGNNYLDGGDGADTIQAGEGNDQIIGGAGNDTISSGYGVDTVNGGGGVHSSSYAFVASTVASWHRNVDGTWTVSANVYAADSDTLTGVEVLDFTDRDVVLDNAQQTFSGNGTSDLLWRHNSNGAIVYWDITGPTQNSATIAGGAGAEWVLEGVGDFSGDGREDLLFRNTTGVAYFWNNANFNDVAFAGFIPHEWELSGIGDFNFDGKDDFLWRNTSNGGFAAWTMNGATPIGQHIIGGAPMAWGVAGIADFNGDGADDILLRHTDGTLAHWTTNGVTQTSAAIIQVVPNDWQIVGLGDFDGDGRADILWRNTGNGGLAQWRMDGITQLGAAIVGGAPLEWHVEKIGDYNGDGKDDIIWRHDDGTVALWVMNGFSVSSAHIVAVVPTEWGLI